MQRIFAIVWLTWKAALRFKLFLVIAALLVISVVGLPLVIQDDGTAQGFTQIILTYTLTAVTSLLGLSTIWLACGTLARDIEECQIQVVATKPIARWQIWLGKWLGIVSLNAALLGIAGACIYGMLEYRAGKLPDPEQQALHDQILVARGSAREASHDAEIEAEAKSILEQRLKTSPVDIADKAEVERQIREGVKADYQLVPSTYTRTWQIDLSGVKDSLAGKTLQVRVKFNAANKSPSGTYDLLWAVGDPQTTKPYMVPTMSVSAETYHEFPVPGETVDSKGILYLTVYNYTPTALIFPLDDGLEVLYPSGGFAMNFVRGLGIIFFWMALMAAIGLMSASFLSFPVATFFSLSLLAIVLSSGTMAESIDSGSIGAGNSENGQAGHTPVDIIFIPAFKGLLAVIKLVQGYSPVDSLSTGRIITWGELGMAFTQIVVFIGGFFIVAGMALFGRRELATAQGTQ